jgi:hypothetical protein
VTCRSSRYEHRFLCACILAASCGPTAAVADGVTVSKIYDPYVQPLEWELEWRLVNEVDDTNPDLQRQSFGVGRSVSDRVFAELYVIGTRGRDESLDVDAFELEAKWQLTEQGEYAVDWGVLFELERETENNAWEFASRLIAARDIGKTTTLVNASLIYEWGEGRENEFETALQVQTRYRYREAFEPAIELHMGQDTIALGPAIIGLWRPSTGKKLRWELGVFAGLDEQSPDRTVKASIEFEF